MRECTAGHEERAKRLMIVGASQIWSAFLSSVILQEKSPLPPFSKGGYRPISVKIRGGAAARTCLFCAVQILVINRPPLNPPVNGGKCVPSPLTERDREGHVLGILLILSLMGYRPVPFFNRGAHRQIPSSNICGRVHVPPFHKGGLGGIFSVKTHAITEKRTTR